MFSFFFRCIAVLLFLLPAGGYGAQAPVSLKPLSVTFSPDKKSVRFVAEINIQPGWLMQGGRSAFTKAPEFYLCKESTCGTPLKSVSLIWPAPKQRLQEDRRVPMYHDKIKLTFDIMTHKAEEVVTLCGDMVVFACAMDSCQRVKLPVGYTLSLSEITSATCQKKTPIAPPSWSMWVWVYVFSFLGGLLLNLMPCVLPVLGIKLLAFSRKAEHDRRLPVGDLWMSVAGIFAGFMALGLLTVSLRALGHTVGWGLHFQNPYFISTMLVALMCFVAHLWGFFDIHVSSGLQKYLGHLMHASRAFLTGVLSVFLATPCTAPFLGTAVGFALSRHPMEIMMIFAMVATGFSAPYWVAALLPSHHISLPKPGRWFLWMQIFLSLCLLGTLLWLITLLAQNFLFMSILVILVAVGLLLFYWWGRGWHVMGYALLIIMLALLFSPTYRFWFNQFSRQRAQTQATCIQWRSFSSFDALTRLVAEGQTVFLDVTASWCLTCRLNKATVLERKDVAAVLCRPGVVCIRADLDEIGGAVFSVLERYKRAGIPFNLVLGPKKPEGIVLGELLTKDSVLKAIEAVSVVAEKK